MTLYRFVPTLHNWREAVFFGWFGPIGVGAIFYYTVAIEAIPVDGPNAHARSLIKPVIYFMVLASVVAHGVTVPLGNLVRRSLTHTSNQIVLDKIIGKRQSPSVDEQVVSNTNSTDTLESIQDNTSKDHATVTISKSPQAPQSVYASQRYNNDYEIPTARDSVHSGAYQLPASNEGMAHRRKSHAT